MPILRWLVIGLIAALLVVVAGLSFVVAVFFLGARTALDTPSDALLFITESGKTSYLIPGDAGNLANPKTPLKPDALAEAKRTYTARCLTCHGSDGKGQTPIGQHTFPRAADLTAARTQSRSDGALFWLVANGIPHTGMPGWKTVLNDDELWSLVAYLRLLPKGADEISKLLPTPTPSPTPPPTPISASATLTVTLDNYAFLPPTLTVSAGTHVVWFNLDNVEHTITSDDKSKLLDSPTITRTQSFTFVFTQPGAYLYHCEIHDYMHGTVAVK